MWNRLELPRGHAHTAVLLTRRFNINSLRAIVRPPRATLLAAGLALVGIGGVLAVTGVTDGGPAYLAVPCASSAAATLANTLGDVGTRIYDSERTRNGSAAVAIRSVTSSLALARAVAASDPVAARAAVTSIVFNHLHIVRLRVTHDGRVLSDVGGPFVLAPISGEIRLHGRLVGRYVLSIQDDVGYVKLAGRLAGLQVVMRSGGRQIVSSLSPAPGSIPRQGTLTFGGLTYVTHTIDAVAFPSGPLQIYLLARRPSPPFTSRTCFQIKVAALGNVGVYVSRRFVLSDSSYGSYILVTQGLTHALVFVRNGSRQLAGSVRPAPALLPDSGMVRFRGLSYGVFSFSTHAAGSRQIHITLLVR